MNRNTRRLVFKLTVVISCCLLLASVTTISFSSFDIRQQDTQYETAQCSCSSTEALHQEIEKLQQFITSLQQQLQQNDPEKESCSSVYVKKQIERSDLLRGKRQHNEYEVNPFNFFTFSKFYPTELGLGRRVVERPLGSKKQDLLEAVNAALALFNSGNGTSHNDTYERKKILPQDFVEGFYRTVPTEGTQYDLWFRKPAESSTELARIQLYRPFGPLVAVRIDPAGYSSPRNQEIVNVVVPLSGRLSTFRSFLDRFASQVLAKDGRLHLTVVFFGDPALWDRVQEELIHFGRRHNFSQFHLLNVNGPFSRAKALQAGAEHWEGPEDAILFFCDVDVAFNAEFIGRCRRQAVQHSQAYFPMVFSLYNPQMVYRLLKKTLPTSEKDQMVISKDSGFWRDFGFGMACTYRSDFLQLGGFHGAASQGWGGEDIFLYRKYLRSSLRIIRSPDPDIFHLWHPKTCPSNLTLENQQACLRSRALSEASHDQLGLLLYANENITNSILKLTFPEH